MNFSPRLYLVATFGSVLILGGCRTLHEEDSSATDAIAQDGLTQTCIDEAASVGDRLRVVRGASEEVVAQALSAKTAIQVIPFRITISGLEVSTSYLGSDQIKIFVSGLVEINGDDFRLEVFERRSEEAEARSVYNSSANCEGDLSAISIRAKEAAEVIARNYRRYDAA